MAINGSELTTRQRTAITALLSGPSVKHAAKVVKIGERTLYRWLHEPAFQAALQAAENDAMDEASRMLLAGQSKALYTLAELMGKAASEQVRRQAAKDWLDLWLKVRELRDLEKRLIELEVKLHVNQE